MDNAPQYYSMLVKIMKYYETAKKREFFGYCFNMTVMNPKFKEKDIIGILTSDDEEIDQCSEAADYTSNQQNVHLKHQQHKQRIQRNLRHEELYLQALHIP